ncbi:MAG: cystathionine beta-synthase [Anaerolineaceae bacterium]|nr:cystathionine beta-synthase [Anaerolineaceae bacterium]
MKINSPVINSKSELQYSENILQVIGHTPLVRLNRVTSTLPALVLAKVEAFNPAGSIKDRIGPTILEAAERQGLVKPGGTIVEATSGNTGAGLALAAAVKGYQCIFVMPDKMSDEKVRYLRAFGARVVITPTAVLPNDPRSYYSVARRLVEETPNSFLANQYYNPANPESHYRSTGPEIWQQTGGQIAVLVAGMGTGGTITGTARYLKEQNPQVKVVGVDIAGSLLYSTWKEGHLPEKVPFKTYQIEGIGEDFVPGTLDLSLIDEAVQVDDRQSFLMARRLVREEGIFIGGSSGSAVAGLLKSELVRALGAGGVAVVLLPDSGSRYLSKLYDDNWMRENGFLSAGSTKAAVKTVVASRSPLPLVTVQPDEHLVKVVSILKEHDISQVPVVDADGKLLGIVTEADLLQHLVHGEHTHDPDETIAGIVNPNVITVQPDADVESVLAVFERGKIVVVTDGGCPVGILTKIDLIDFLANQI